MNTIILDYFEEQAALYQEYAQGKMSFKQFLEQSFELDLDFMARNNQEPTLSKEVATAIKEEYAF